MEGFDFYIRKKEDLIKAVESCGFVPLFRNSIKGFSVEEHVAPEVWFSGDEGVWEWKGPVIRATGCAYGKFFDRKAVFISREWFPDFANYRRDGYDFDALYDDGKARFGDKYLYELIEKNAPVSSKALKILGDYGKNGKKGFEGIITRLQEQCYVITDDFVYQLDRHGNRYGWGVAEYSTPEVFMGKDFTERVYSRSPEQSFERVLTQLKGLLPDAQEEALKKLLKKGNVL